MHEPAMAVRDRRREISNAPGCACSPVADSTRAARRSSERTVKPTSTREPPRAPGQYNLCNSSGDPVQTLFRDPVDLDMATATADSTEPMADAGAVGPVVGSIMPKSLGKWGVHNIPAARGSKVWLPRGPACLNRPFFTPQTFPDKHKCAHWSPPHLSPHPPNAPSMPP